MSEPKEDKKPLDMTSDEAVNFLFPKDAVDEMKRVANPDELEQFESNNNGDSSAYEEC